MTLSFGLIRVLPRLVAERASELSQTTLNAAELTLSPRFEPTESQQGCMRAAEQAWYQLDSLYQASEQLLFVTLVESSTAEDPFCRILFRMLNERRNSLTQRLGRPLCWMLGPRLWALSTEHAPHFWSIRSHTRTPTAYPPPPRL